LRASADLIAKEQSPETVAPAPVSIPALLAALGGANNVAAIEERAGRVLVRVTQSALVDASALDALIERGCARTLSGTIHLLSGAQTPTVAAGLRSVLTA
jgi:PTS system N-acetylglucosamine-specific IIC component